MIPGAPSWQLAVVRVMFVLEWQDQHYRWHRYGVFNGRCTAYRTAEHRTRTTGKKHRLVDGDGQLLDLFHP
tara:strand:- start:6738 stop:6950 length:213 start_codon:yes stop_codon:yes gene_type:complete